MEQVCIIVPLYNTEKYIVRCIKSILKQSYNFFSIVIVDDGSSDASSNICDQLLKLDSRIFIIHKYNGGISNARNTGLDFSIAARPESNWISFVDSDDYIHKEYLKTLLNLCVYNGIKISYCEELRTKETSISDEKILINNYELSLMKPEECVCASINYLYLWGKIFHKSLFIKSNIRFPERKDHEDRFITYKLLFQEDVIAHSNLKLYYYYIRVGSISNSGWSPIRMDDFEACEEQISYFNKNGYERAKRHTINQYLMNLSDAFFYSKEFSKEHRIIKKKLKKYLMIYKDYIPNERYNYMYYSIRPISRLLFKIRNVIT